ncbi:MAG: T9SS type A sorting domain-containing protein, partial [Bacteroidetes bacterium]|nr:T9SS type A sorting domain-containing protein [Bacteroidota bacterium]
GNAWHFMSLPTGLAFSKNGNWASSIGAYDANHDGGAPFAGPTLWSGDLAIFAQPSGGNGSHLDMLHASPYSQGVASEKDNVFWVFDGNSNDIVRYDFVDDHGPGNSSHGDGIIHRYSDFSVAKDPNNKVSSHLVVDNEWVYVVDYGNKKVFRIQIGTGIVGGTPGFGPYEVLAEYKNVSGYTTNDVVTTGLVEPSGIDIVGDRMIVSDYNTGEVIIYDITNIPAVELDRINTGALGIMGIKIGHDGKIWYVDYDANTVNLIDIQLVSTNEIELNNVLSVYPNPVNNELSINFQGVFKEAINVNVYDLTGKLVYNTIMNNNHILVNTENLTNGIYQVQLSNDVHFLSKKIVIQH